MEASVHGITAPSAVYELEASASRSRRRALQRPSPMLTHRACVLAACASSRVSRCTWRVWAMVTSSSACRIQAAITRRLLFLRTAGRVLRPGSATEQRDHGRSHDRRDDTEAGLPAFQNAGTSDDAVIGKRKRQRRYRRHEALAERLAALPVGSGRTDSLATGLRRKTDLGYRAKASVASCRSKDRPWRGAAIQAVRSGSLLCRAAGRYQRASARAVGACHGVARKATAVDADDR